MNGQLLNKTDLLCLSSLNVLWWCSTLHPDLTLSPAREVIELMKLYLVGVPPSRHLNYYSDYVSK